MQRLARIFSPSHLETGLGFEGGSVNVLEPKTVPYCVSVIKILWLQTEFTSCSRRYMSLLGKLPHDCHIDALGIKLG